jgi:hypothetical protein
MNFCSGKWRQDHLCGDIVRPFLKIICLAYLIDIQKSASGAESAEVGDAS